MAHHIILDTVVEETLIFKMKQVQKYKAQYEGQYAYGGKMLISGDKQKFSYRIHQYFTRIFLRFICSILCGTSYFISCCITQTVFQLCLTFSKPHKKQYYYLMSDTKQT